MAFSSFDDLTLNKSQRLIAQQLAAKGALTELTEVLRLLIDIEVTGTCDGVTDGSIDPHEDLRFYLQDRQDKLRAFLEQKPENTARL